MERQIFINLPVSNITASAAFYAALGAARDERFCDGSSAMMRFTDTITVMLLEQERFASFTPKQIADARTHSEVLLCLSCADRAEVDKLVDIAAWAGGRADPGLRAASSPSTLAPPGTSSDHPVRPLVSSWTTTSNTTWRSSVTAASSTICASASPT